MPKRNGMQPVYVGDVGEIWHKDERKQIPTDEELDSMDMHQLFAVLIDCGVKVYDIIGVKTCGEHYGMVLLGSNAMPAGYNLLEHTKYCKNCFQLFRLRRLPV